MTSNQLKLLAFACMVADHASKAFLLPDGGFSNIIMMIGRISFPIFAFCIAQGYLHTSNIGLYQWRLLLFGILAQPFYITCLSLPVTTLNTLFTFLISIAVSLSGLLLDVFFYYFDRRTTRAEDQIRTAPKIRLPIIVLQMSSKPFTDQSGSNAFV